MNLGKAIRAKRRQMGWTQGVAAQQIGIRQSYLSKLENDQFIPSEAVLARLKSVYNLTEQEIELVSANPLHSTASHSVTRYSTPITIKHIAAAVLLVMALSLLYVAQSGLLYNQTYYTYKATALDNSSEVQGQVQPLLLNYELTDEYQGEVYMGKFAGHTYHYALIGTRTIERKENTWLTLVSGLLAIMALWYLIYSVVIRSHPLRP